MFEWSNFSSKCILLNWGPRYLGLKGNKLKASIYIPVHSHKSHIPNPSCHPHVEDPKTTSHVPIPIHPDCLKPWQSPTFFPPSGKPFARGGLGPHHQPSMSHVINSHSYILVFWTYNTPIFPHLFSLFLFVMFPPPSSVVFSLSPTTNSIMYRFYL